MRVDVDSKEEGSNEENSSSAIDNGSNTSSTVARTPSVPITGHGDMNESNNKFVDPVASTLSNRSDGCRSTTLEPAQKRIKLENEAIATITSASRDETSSASFVDDGIGNSSNVAAKVFEPTTTKSSTTTMDSSSGMSKPVAPASALSDNAITNTTTADDTFVTVKPQHSLPSTTVHGQQNQAQGIPPPMSNFATVTRRNPVKVEASSSTSSNNSQGGSSSVITASIESSPQHTSQSSNTSADSSNESLHDSETNPSKAPSAKPMTLTKGSPITERGVVQPTTVGPTVHDPRPTMSEPSASLQKSEHKITEKPTRTRTLSPASKEVSGRNHLSTSAASSTITAPLSTTNISAVSTSKEVPLKSLNFGHLRIKYLGELEYMLREFRKLERQLLGAKGAQQLEESVGSRERREKLHSFILHLEDTIRQIEIGCKIEDSRNSAAEASNKNVTEVGAAIANSLNSAGNSAGNPARDSTSSNIETAADETEKQLVQESVISRMKKDKEEEETVQKLEEHILANLLPVKVRLKKQLAAQQGATQNPPGMPAMRRGTLQPSSTTRGKGTFVEAVEKKRKHAESLRLAAQVQHERQVRSVSDPTQFGKPLSGVGSSLTKKLHGSTLGSKHRRTGHGVGSAVVTKDTQERKILHAGMVPKSTQQESGLSAASGAHEMITTTIQSDHKPATAALTVNVEEKSTTTQNLQVSSKNTAVAGKPKGVDASKLDSKTSAEATTIVSDAAKHNKQIVTSSKTPTTEEERLKYKKHRRLRKLKRLKRRREREMARQQSSKSQQIANISQLASNTTGGRKKAGHGKVGQKKKGPRVVEYICSQCSEAYNSTCDCNPWWALAQHKCPKCQKTQIPRIDITSPANVIEYHPALLSHLEDGSRGGAGSIPGNSVQSVAPSIPIVSQIPDSFNSVNSESDSDLSELSDDNISIGSLKAAELESELQSMTPAERAENETFGKEYDGPVLSEEHAAKLLILMGHASTCPCHHKSEKLKDVCRSTKYMMLHVRDCPGTTSTFDVCPFPWCRKVKHLLYHLVSCTNPDQCAICSPKDLPKGLNGLVGLNAHRGKKYREHLLLLSKASQEAKVTKTNSASKKQTTTRRTTSATQANSTRKPVSEKKTPVLQQRLSSQRLPCEKSATKPKSEVPKEQTPYISSKIICANENTGARNINQLPVKDRMVTQPNPVMTYDSTQLTAPSNDLDFDINAEIAKLDEHLTQESNRNCVIVPVKQEQETTKIPIVDTQVKVEANAVAGSPNHYTTISASEMTNDHIISTPMAVHDADAAELSDLLAPNISSDDNVIPEGDVTDVSEYLKNEYHISPQCPKDAISVSEHQHQIDIVSGPTGVYLTSDTLAMNHDVLVETAPVPVSTDTRDEVEQEYSETMNAPSVQPTPDVSTVTVTAKDVESAIGSVKVQ